MIGFVKQAKIARLIAAAFVITAIAALAVLSARSNHAEAVTTFDIEVGPGLSFCTPGQNPCPANNPFDTTVSASNGDKIKFTQIGGTHTASHCTDDTFSDCTGNLFDFSPATGEWPVSVNNSNVYFVCRFHPQMTGLIIVGSPTTPSPSPTPTPAPTPTPIPVGGIADFPDIDGSPADAAGSSGDSSFTLALVSGVVAALAMFAAGAWYARRRWLS